MGNTSTISISYIKHQQINVVLKQYLFISYFKAFTNNHMCINV